MTSPLPPKPKIDLKQYLNTDGSLKARKVSSAEKPSSEKRSLEERLSEKRVPAKPPLKSVPQRNFPDHSNEELAQQPPPLPDRHSPGKRPPLPERPSSFDVTRRASSIESRSPTKSIPMPHRPYSTSAESSLYEDSPPPILSRRASDIDVASPPGYEHGTSPSSLSRVSSISSLSKSPTRKSSSTSLQSSLSPTRNYAPKPASNSVPLQTHLADHRPPAQIPTSFLLNKCRRILAANNRYICVDTGSKTLLYSWRSSSLVWRLKTAVLCATFVNETATIWLGTIAGRILIVDYVNGQTTQVLERGHMKPVTYIAATAYGVVSFSADDGKLNIWSPRNSGSPCKVSRVRGSVSGRSSLISTGGMTSQLLWLCKDRQVEVYQPANQMLPLISAVLPGRGVNLGTITSIAAYDDMAFFGQNDGFVAVFKGTHQLGVINGGIHSITALCAPQGTELWVGTRSGEILIFGLRLSFDSRNESAQLSGTLLRQWKAHHAAISHIMLAESKAAIVTTDKNHTVLAWNSTPVDVLSTSPSNTEGFKVQVYTWNVGACSPETVPYDWIVGPSTADADVLVVGLQEVVELENTSQHALNMVRPSDVESDKDHAKWQHYLETLLIPHGFTLVAAKSMVGIMSCLFVKTSTVKFLSNVRSEVVKTGIGGTYGNKGGVVMNFDLARMSWCFANCHLAAGHTAIIQRNRDASQIMTADRLQSDVCFFFGDTNYRMNAAREQAEQLIKDKNWEKLRKQDQLQSQILKNPSFCLSRFQEGVLDFPPTYKYDRGSSLYDTSDKKRIPSWCDRILFRGKSVQVQEYDAVQKSTASDHKPVVGTYFVPLLV